MSYKTILAFLPSSRRAAQVAKTAVSAAKKCGAHVIGLHVIATFPPYGELAEAVPAETMKKLREPAQREAEAVEILFRESTRMGGLSSEWRCLTADYSSVVDIVVQEARGAELVVCGNHEADDPFNSWLDIPDRVMLESGRPVLFVPLSPVPDHFAEKVVIAWNNTREAARAAFDAAPLLSGSAVELLAINPPDRRSAETYEHGVRLVDSLARHGARVSTQTVTVKDTSAGEYILDHVKANACDLLVMGGYGHSRFREMLLGGVTREIINDIEILTLMSH